MTALIQAPTLLNLLEVERKRVDTLLQRHAELRDESEALRDWLEGAGFLNRGPYLAVLHRHRFERMLRSYPCTFEATFEACLGATGLPLVVAGFAGYGSAAATRQCSRGLREQLDGVASQLATVLPPAVYAIGGEHVLGEVLSTVEALDTLSGKWTPLAPLAVQRSRCCATVLGGRIYAAGGWGMNGQTLDSVECFDPQLGRWRAAPSLLQGRADASGATVHGRFYLFGGRSRPPGWEEDEANFLPAPVSSAEALEADGRQWERLPAVAVSRHGAASAAVGSCIYLTGGFGSEAVELADVEIFDPLAAAWRSGPPLRTARAHHSAAGVRDTVYIVGGLVDQGQAQVRSIEFLSPGATAWDVMSSPHERLLRQVSHAAVCCGGQLFVVGGSPHELEPQGLVAARYDAERESWVTLPRKRGRHARVLFTAVACRPVESNTAVSGTEVQCCVS